MTGQTACALVVRPAPDPAESRKVEPVLRTAGQTSDRPISRSIARAWNGHCPCCGAGARLTAMRSRGLVCAACGEDYGQLELGSAASLFVIPPAFGSAAIAAVLCEEFLAVPLAVEALVAVLLGMLTTAWLLPRAYGLALGLAWALDVEGAGTELRINVKTRRVVDAGQQADPLQDGVVASQ